MPVYAGTDAGSTIEHGRIADEALALAARAVPNAVTIGQWRWPAA
ncbi:amidohydrolase [Mycobacterium tuberculosis]|nr:amidohydrolase [Mycobacterium tuberculosis]